MLYTTLNKIRDNHSCVEGWRKLLGYLGKTKADDEPLSFKTILDSNGLDYAIWALRCVEETPEMRLFAVRCVRQIQHLITDKRALDALDVAERFAVGDATEEELLEAYFTTCDCYCTDTPSTSPRVYDATNAALTAWAALAAWAVAATTTSAAAYEVADSARKAAVNVCTFEKERSIPETPVYRSVVDVEVAAYRSQKDDFVSIFCV